MSSSWFAASLATGGLGRGAGALEPTSGPRAALACANWDRLLAGVSSATGSLGCEGGAGRALSGACSELPSVSDESGRYLGKIYASRREREGRVGVGSGEVVYARYWKRKEEPSL